MKKKIIPAILAATLIVGSSAMVVEAEKQGNNEQEVELKESKELIETEKTSEKDKKVKEEVDIEGQSAIVYDMKKQEVIFEKNAEQIIPTASLAKVMTLYITLEKIENGELKLTDKVKVSKTAFAAKGSTMFLNVGSEMTVEDMIRGIAIVSGNDGAIAIGEHIAGDTKSFVKLMNKKAKELGMENTKFLTPSGFGNDEGFDTSNSKDLLILTKNYVEKFEKYLKYHQELEFVTPKSVSGGREDIPQKATNGLLKTYEGMLGLKTGYVEDAFNLIGVSERQGIKMISVVMASNSSSNRESDTAKLLDYGYSKYRVYTLSSKGEKYDTLPVYKASDINKVDVIVKKDVKVTIHETEKGKGKITETMDMPVYLKGGIKKGDVIGTKTVKLNGKKIATIEYTVAEDLPAGNLLLRSKDSLFLTFEWMKNKF